MPLTVQPYHGYTIGSRTGLEKAQLESLVELFELCTVGCCSDLEGRTPIRCGSVDTVGPVAVKTYTRGGLMQRVSKHHYLRTGKTRCQIEFEMLSTARRCRINAPDPIAFACRGRLIYRGWLVTRKVPNPLSLAQLGLTDENRCRRALAALADQIGRLVENRLLHVDLHPGNVLVDERQRVCIVDFDRARIDHRPEHKLRRRYLSRWDRAIAKHSLPQLLSEGLHAGLGGLTAKP